MAVFVKGLGKGILTNNQQEESISSLRAELVAIKSELAEVKGLLEQVLEGLELCKEESANPKAEAVSTSPTPGTATGVSGVYCYEGD